MLTGAYFDGRSAKRHTVRLSVSQGQLEVSGEGIALTVAPAQIKISEPMGSAPRTLRLPGGGMIEVAPGIELDTLLVGLQHRHSFAVALQSRWRWAVLAFLLIAAVFFAGYRWGLPLVAKAAAPHMPAELIKTLSDNTLELLDEHMLKPSTLPAKRQAELQAGFARLLASDPQIADARLLFRSAPKAGPNAFALPDGQIVVLDELVVLGKRDEDILAVLAHELGHVHHHHGIRQGIQSSIVSAIAAAWLGDVSSLATMFSTLLLTSNYSREMEEEADDYAIERFRQLGLPGSALASILEAMEAAHQEKHPEVSKDEDTASELFSTHPETAKRIRRLREKAGAA